MRVYGGRLAAMVAALVFTGALLAARLLAAPTADGYRWAIAPAPLAGLYAVEGTRVLLLGPQGGVREVGHTLGGLPLVLSGEGDALLLGTDAGVQVSADGGRSWRAVGPAGRYPAVLRQGPTLLAGAWGKGLEVSTDSGRTWRLRQLPGSEEILALAGAGGAWYAATLTGVAVSADAGQTWTAVPGTQRATALASDQASLLVGTWRGGLFRVTGAVPESVGEVHAGVWALLGTLVGTTDGLRGTRDPQLAHAEVTALAASGSVLYAGVARGPLYRSANGGDTWQAVHG